MNDRAEREGENIGLDKHRLGCTARDKLNVKWLRPPSHFKKTRLERSDGKRDDGQTDFFMSGVEVMLHSDEREIKNIKRQQRKLSLTL